MSEVPKVASLNNTLRVFANHTGLLTRSRLARQWWPRRMREELRGVERARLGSGHRWGWGAGTISGPLAASSTAVPGWALLPQPPPSSESVRVSVSCYVLRLLSEGLSAAFPQASPFRLYKARMKIVCSWHICTVLQMKAAICVSLEYWCTLYLVRDLRKKLPSKKETLSVMRTFEFHWKTWWLVSYISQMICRLFCT